MTSTATIIRISEMDTTPGPGAYNIPSDFGSARSYTIKHRYKERQDVISPRYNKLPDDMGSGPKYSLSSRHKTKDYVAAPGPNYMPPKLGSEAPGSAFHIKGKDASEKIPGPGPGKYDLSTKHAGKSYTMKARKFNEDEGKADGPGPGKYLPDYDKVLPSSRKSGIGDVRRERKGDVTPGPGQYEIDRRPESKPASFHGKRREFKYDDIPGPGKYEPEKHRGKDTPSWTCRPRYEEKKELIRAPYQKLPDEIGSGPKWTLHGKGKDRKPDVVPGPSYMPPAFGSEGRKWSMRSRSVQKRDPSKEPPGPGRYDIKDDNKGPKWSMKARKFNEDEGKPDGPGAGKYNPSFDAVMESSRKTAIHEKFKEKKPDHGQPYYDLGSTLNGPKFTIGRRETLRVAPGNT